MEDFSTFEFAFQAAEVPDGQLPDQRAIRRRPLTEAQRLAKIEGDRERRRKYRVEFERLKNVEFQFNQLLPRFEELQAQFMLQTNVINELKEENNRLMKELLILTKRKDELENAILESAAADRNYRALKKNLLLHGCRGNQPVALIGRENQMIWSTPTRPGSHLPAPMPNSVQTQVSTECVIDKETVTNQFTMRDPFFFVASKPEEVSCIRLRGKCSASLEGGLLQYMFEWIPHQTNQESWENLGWSPVDDVGLIQRCGPHRTRSSCGAQANLPMKFLLWNSVGALNAYRQSIVMDLVNRLQPVVLVLTETRLSRARAEEIIDTFPFDGHRVTPNLGFVGGMWLFWRSGVVDVEVLSFTEQEIHALIKVPQANQNSNPWGFFTQDVNFDSLDETQSFLVPSSVQVANSKPLTEAQGSSAQSTALISTRYADELVEDFTKKLEAIEKNDVKFSDFRGLDKEELKTIEEENLPRSLAPIRDRIEMVYGDITAGSRLPNCIVRACYVLLCSVIKEMDHLKLEQVDEKKMLFWRDAINSGLSIGFRVNFVIDHLKNIARAYYGLKAWNNQDNDQKDLENIERRMSELKIELFSLKERHAKKLEEQNSEVRKQCINVAEQFWGKPLSTFLFLPQISLPP